MECELANITVHYETFGEGKPLIILHGWSLDYHHMRRDIEPIFNERTGWKRIYLDLPGHGKTQRADWITKQDDVLDVILAFIDKVIPGERFAVAGTSYGAYLARGIVYRRPQMMNGLLLIVPVVATYETKRIVPPPVTLIEDQPLSTELTTDEAEVWRFAVVQSRELLDRIRADRPKSMAEGNQTYQDRIRDSAQNYSFSFDVDALSEPFPAPTLIITGRQDAIVGYRNAWDIIENYPRATFVTLDCAGHMLGVEQKRLMHELMSEWLDRVEEYS